MIADLYLFCHFGFLMAAGHAVADRPLQEGVIRAEKYAPRGNPDDRRWLSGLMAHSLIHGGFVAWITGIWWLGLAETIAHGLIDDQKLCGRYGNFTDQGLHIVCKAMWAMLAVSIVTA